MTAALAGWRYETPQATFSILPQGNGRWQVWCDDDALGSYHRPEAALDDLVGNHCFSNRKGLDTSVLGIPRDLSGWRTVVRRT